MTPSSAHNHRPWWWRHSKRRIHDNDDDLGDPLLSPSLPHWASEHQNQSYVMHHGMTTPEQDESFWSRLRRMGPPQSSSTTPRDDGSVDFASVQEEWASRSEQDPLWWSREEEEEES